MIDTIRMLVGFGFGFGFGFGIRTSIGMNSYGRE